MYEELAGSLCVCDGLSSWFNVVIKHTQTKNLMTPMSGDELLLY